MAREEELSRAEKWLRSAGPEGQADRAERLEAERWEKLFNILHNLPVRIFWINLALGLVVFFVGLFLAAIVSSAR